MKKAIVVTTIHGITDAISQFLQFEEWDVILVGDKKTPPIDDDHDRLTYLDIDTQETIAETFHNLMPYNHYCRKNIGYLYAIQNGYDRIADTDDDNIPYDDWENWEGSLQNLDKITEPKYPNVYKLYSDDFIWPRGYPLWKISENEEIKREQQNSDGSEAAIVQGLANQEPDVDAIYRLIFDREVAFDTFGGVTLDKSVYSPFNSQNTLWKPSAYTYMYLPTTVKFRFTDILRGYIAQRGIWEIGKRLAFVDASVEQDRNFHNLMDDFKSEIPCYTQISTVVEGIESVELQGNPEYDLIKMYEELVRRDVVGDEELGNVTAWVESIGV